MLLLGVLVHASLPSAHPSDEKVCFCPNWRYSNFNCSAACCDAPPSPGHLHPSQYICKPPPVPNPPTDMATVTVDGAVEMGALTPRGEAPTIEFNKTGARGWVIHMSGGGWGFLSNASASSSSSSSSDCEGCGGAGAFKPDGTSPQASASLSPTPTSFANQSGWCYLKCDGIMSGDAAQNPLFHGYNKVFVPINDGTSFTGNLDKRIPASNPPVYPHKWPVYIRGGRIVTAVMSFLMKQHGMSDATDVIITGGSSGGMATYLNCDRIADQVALPTWFLPQTRRYCWASSVRRPPVVRRRYPAVLSLSRPPSSFYHADACCIDDVIADSRNQPQHQGVVLGRRWNVFGPSRRLRKPDAFAAVHRVFLQVECNVDDQPGLCCSLHPPRHAVEVHLLAVRAAVHQDPALYRAESLRFVPAWPHPGCRRVHHLRQGPVSLPQHYGRRDPSVRCDHA